MYADAEPCAGPDRSAPEFTDAGGNLWWRDRDGRPWVRLSTSGPQRYGFPADVRPAGLGDVPSLTLKTLGWARNRLHWSPGTVAHISGSREATLGLGFWLAGEVAKDREMHPIRFTSARNFAESWETPYLADWRMLIIGDVIASIGIQRLRQVVSLLAGRKGRSVVILGEAEIGGEDGIKLRSLLDYDGARRVAA